MKPSCQGDANKSLRVKLVGIVCLPAIGSNAGVARLFFSFDETFRGFYSGDFIVEKRASIIVGCRLGLAARQGLESCSIRASERLAPRVVRTCRGWFEIANFNRHLHVPVAVSLHELRILRWLASAAPFLAPANVGQGSGSRHFCSQNFPRFGRTSTAPYSSSLDMRHTNYAGGGERNIAHKHVFAACVRASRLLAVVTSPCLVRCHPCSPTEVFWVHPG